MDRFYLIKEVILKRAADTLETCYPYPCPRPSYHNTKTTALFPLYKSPLNDSIPSYTNGGFFINSTSSPNGCTSSNGNQVPTHPQTPPFLSLPPCSNTTDESRIIMNGQSGPLPSVSTLTTSCNNTASHSENDNQQLSLMLPIVPGNPFSNGYSNFQITPGMVPSNFQIPASPSMISGATGW